MRPERFREAVRDRNDHPDDRGELLANLARLTGIDFNASTLAILLYFACAMVAATAAALLLYRYVEAPVLNLSKRLTMPKRLAVQPSQA